MRILQFKVTGQNLSKDGDFSGIVAGTKGYLYTAYNFDGESIRNGTVAGRQPSFQDTTKNILSRS